jgi:hypothetical protein
MNNVIDADAVRVQSLRQAFENGVEEIYIGLFALVMGGVYLVAFNVPHGSTIGQIMSFGTSFFQIAFVLLMVAARKKINAAYVFPRTGYVVFRPAKWRMRTVWALGIASLALAIAMTIWSSQLPDLRPMTGVIAGAGLAGCLLWGGITYHLPHLNWIGALSLAIGIATYFADAKAAGMLWVLAGVGVALALSGALRFRTFLKTHPVIEEAQ